MQLHHSAIATEYAFLALAQQKNMM